MKTVIFRLLFQILLPRRYSRNITQCIEMSTVLDHDSYELLQSDVFFIFMFAINDSIESWISLSPAVPRTKKSIYRNRN